MEESATICNSFNTAHVLRTLAPPESLRPGSSPDCALSCVLHPAPWAATPFAHAHSFVAHSRFCVVLGATVWYSASVHTVQGEQLSPLR